MSWNTSTNAVTSFGPICCSQNVVYDMNNDGVAVGYSAIQFDVFRAVLWWEGQPYELTDRVVNVPDIGKSVFLHVATGINSAGQIVGKFGGFASGEPLDPGRVFMLTPIEPKVPGDVNGDGHVNILDLLAVVAAWGACGSPCPADVTGDGTVNILDLLFVVANWG